MSKAFECDGCGELTKKAYLQLMVGTWASGTGVREQRGQLDYCPDCAPNVAEELVADRAEF